MTSSPFNLYTGKTANQAAKVRVFLGAADGTNDEWKENFDLIPIEIVRLAGSRPDYAVFEFDTSLIVENVDVTGTVTALKDEIGFNRQVYVDLVGITDEFIPPTKTIFWGELLTETLMIDGRSQRITITARIADYHFGDLLEGELRYDPDTDDLETVPVDPVFNPLIDGVIEPNAAVYESPLDVSIGVVKDTWTDPESVRSENAQDTVNQDEPALWILPGIVRTLCLWLNEDEEFFENPVDLPRSAHNNLIFFLQLNDGIWENAPAIKNMGIPKGLHLPQLLDRILVPNGYNWFVSPKTPQDVSGKVATIEFFRRGEGIARWLKLQPAGEELDPAKSNTEYIRVQTDVGNLANEIHGWGSFEQKELTIELFRGWLESEDGFDEEDLRKSEPTSEYATNGVTAAWRWWIGNEDGSATGLRTTVQPITLLDLTSVFERAIPARRIVEDCLTLDSDGHRRMPFLEWSDDNGSTWSEVPPEWGWVIMPNRIGIEFTGDIPPPDMIAAGNNCKVRITCTITGDARLYSTSSPILDESPSLRTVPLFLDLSDRYHKRSRQATGDFASILTGTADTADDASDMQTFLADTLENELSADVRCDFRLHGIHTQYEIGDLITFVDGRDIFLNRNKPDPALQAARKYVQIVGLRYLIQSQQTELIVESVDR